MQIKSVGKPMKDAFIVIFFNLIIESFVYALVVELVHALYLYNTVSITSTLLNKI